VAVEAWRELGAQIFFFPHWLRNTGSVLPGPLGKRVATYGPFGERMADENARRLGLSPGHFLHSPFAACFVKFLLFTFVLFVRGS
jgi:hypothetical protein